MDSFNTQELEAFILQIMRANQSKAAVLIIVNQEDRAEIVAGNRTDDSIGSLLRRAADQLDDGAGIPLGSHLKQFPG